MNDKSVLFLMIINGLSEYFDYSALFALYYGNTEYCENVYQVE